MLDDQIVIVVVVIRHCIALLRAIHPRHGGEVHYFGAFEENSELQF